MIIIKNPEQIKGIRKSCILAAKVLEYCGSLVREGISTQYINDEAANFIKEHGATAAPLGYNGFPRSICTSINNVVCHGIPSPHEILKNGDIINIDITTILNGYYGDTSATFAIGEISQEAQKLIDVTRQSMYKAIGALLPGKKMSSCVGETIEDYVKKYGFSPVRDLGGHGVGVKFHEDPFVFHFKHPNYDTILKPGMTFTVEPMINGSLNWQVTLDKSDGWTIRTQDGSLSAQFEHTVLITDTGSEILTKL